MLSATLILFGLVSYDRIGVDRYPKIDAPIISVTTALPGANPEVIDASVTNLIETAVNAVPGIDHVRSSSSPGASVVQIQFNLSKNTSQLNSFVQPFVIMLAQPLAIVGGVAGLWLAREGGLTRLCGREACPVRLRPVLMTSLTIIITMLPAALGFGAGVDTNGPMAVAVIGGMVTSKLLTLVVVPAAYSLVENGQLRLRDWRKCKLVAPGVAR